MFSSRVEAPGHRESDWDMQLCQSWQDAASCGAEQCIAAFVCNGWERRVLHLLRGQQGTRQLSLLVSSQHSGFYAGGAQTSRSAKQIQCRFSLPDLAIHPLCPGAGPIHPPLNPALYCTDPVHRVMSSGL